MEEFLQYREFDITIKYINFFSSDYMEKGMIFRCPTGRPVMALVYVLDGSSEYHFQSETVTVHAGDLIMLVPGEPYSFEVLSDTFHYSYVDFEHEEGRENTFQFKNTVYTFQNKSLFRNDFEKLGACYLYKNTGYRMKMREIIDRILYQIAVHLCNSYLPSEKYRKIDSSVEYLSKHFMDFSLTMQQVALLSELSESQFRRIFKEIYSVSPIQYINALRIERAKDLLVNSTRPVALIAEEAGFSDVYHFNKQFKTRTGKTPSQYRKALQIQI